MEGVSAIKQEMAKYGYTPKTCIWNQVGKLNRKPKEVETVKVVPEVVFDQIKEQRTRELYSSRTEGNNEITESKEGSSQL